MANIPAKTTTLVFLRQGNYILLAMKKHGFGAGRWNGVGGKLDAGETIKQALVRECREEIGVTPLEWQKVAVHDFIMDDDGAAPWRMVVHTYLCDEWEGSPVETDEMSPKWFRLDRIPYDDMWQDDIVWLPLVLRGKKLRCQFRFDRNDTMVAGSFEVVHKLP